jgi:hypothetical protein
LNFSRALLVIPQWTSAEKLHADLQEKGVRYWFAPSDMKIGDRIDESIRFHDELLLVLSADSISSRWVETEVETAMEHERRGRGTLLFPIRVEDVVIQTDKASASEYDGRGILAIAVKPRFRGC